MNFWFEMAVNAVEVTLILSFLVQYFGYKTETSAKYWGTALIWILSFCIVAFFSWTHLYENYASSLQILVNILFCVTLLRGNIFQKIFVSAFTMGLVAITATLTTLLVAKLSGNQVAFLLSHFSGIRVTSICLTKLLFFVITRIILRIKESGKLKGMDVIALVIVPMLSDLAITLMMYAAIQEPSIQTIVLYAVGIVLIVRSALGTTPISSVNYVLSLNTPLTLGAWTFIVNVLLIMGQLWLVRKVGSRQDVIEILLQIPFSFIFSAFIDFNMIITTGLHPNGYLMSLALLIIGCVIQSIGVVLEIKPRVAMMSAEGFVKYASRYCNKEFGKFKVYFDITLVSLAVVISLMFTQRIEGIREGSFIAACITGYIVTFLNQKIMTRKMLHRLFPILR